MPEALVLKLLAEDQHIMLFDVAMDLITTRFLVEQEQEKWRRVLRGEQIATYRGFGLRGCGRTREERRGRAIGVPQELKFCGGQSILA
jgi:hypothetical protein